MIFSPRLACVLLTLGIGHPQAASAQSSYPARPIRMILPASPGGPVDVIARTVGAGLSDALGQSIVMDNRAGAGGIIGAETVARATPDGYTLMIAHSGPLAIEAAIHAKLPYQPLKDFAHVSLVAAAPYALVVNSATPVKSVHELIALAKSRPGRLHFASGGIGTGIHMAGELFNLVAGVKIVHVPYKGAGPSMTALMSGEVDMMFNGLPAALPHVKAGRVRALAISSLQRSSLLPELPTVAESGLRYETSGWYGLVAPAGTPRDIVAKLNAALVRALGAPEMKERLAGQGIEGIGSSPEQFRNHLREELAKWARVIAAAGLKEQK